MNIANLRVITRLGMSFGASVILMALMAAVGLARLSTLNDDLDLMSATHLPRLLLANRMVNSSTATAKKMQDALGIEDKSALRRELDGIAADLTERDRHFRELENMSSTAEGDAGFRVLAAAHADYLPAAQEFIALAVAGNTSAAGEVLMKKLRPRQAACADALQALIQIETAAVTSAGTHAREVYGSGRDLIVGLGLIAALVSIVASWIITRSLLRQLGGEPGYAASAAGRIADGDLAFHIDIKSDDVSSLLFAMKGMRDRLAAIVSHVRAGTDAIAAASAQIAQGNNELSFRTESQASSVGAAAHAMDELTERVRQNNDRASQAAQLATAASAVAAAGGDAVSKMIATMNAIDASGKRIGDIIGVIDGIAFQTNILALNAAVEAARAGEQGRGFAVVASEVRTLAQRSASAAKEIKGLIGESTDTAALGSRLAAEAGATMREVVASIERVNHLMGEMRDASQRETATIEEINASVGDMDVATQQNAALVEEAAAAAQCLQDQAGKLAAFVSVFKLDLDGGAAVRRPFRLRREAESLAPMPVRLAG